MDVKENSGEKGIQQEENFLRAQKILWEYFTYKEFKPEQKACITELMAGRDVLAMLPTGFGKSLCFQIPALYFKGLTIVVTPLVSLMQDQVAQITRPEDNPSLKKIIAATYLGSMQKNKDQILIDCARGKYKILYVAPERLKDPVFLRFTEKVDIDFMAVDEAHCISMWGYDFRPAYLEILRFVGNLKRRPVMGAFTATATRAVREDIERLLGLEIEKQGLVRGGFQRENLRFSVRKVGKASKKRFIRNYLIKHPEDTGIIYCSTIEDTEKLYGYLEKRAFHPAIYHGECGRKEREDNYRKFMGDPDCQVMVATNAFGMGINKENVRFVIHYNMPRDMEGYYQEAGRAGRDDKPAECILLYYRLSKREREEAKRRNRKITDDYDICRMFLENVRTNNNFDEDISQYRYQLGKYRLDKIAEYCELSGHCMEKRGRRATTRDYQDFIIRYFEEPLPGKLLRSEYVRQKEEAFLEKKRSEILGLYYNNTRIANDIRKGAYTLGEEKQVDCGRRKPAKEASPGKEMVVSYKIEAHGEERLTYFDMMIADAVYTLETNHVPVIYPKTIYEVLSGDFDVTLKPEKKAFIEKSLEKMGRMTITIDCSRAGKGRQVYEDEKETGLYRGNFLPLEKRGKRGYFYEEIPPLYGFATAFHIKGQFLTFSMKNLRVLDERDVKLPASEENLKIVYYLLSRLAIMAGNKKRVRADGSRRESVTSRVILYDTLLKATGIVDELPEDKYLRKRKLETIYGKIHNVLDFYVKRKSILAYEACVDEYSSTRKKQQVKGVKIQFPQPFLNEQ